MKSCLVSQREAENYTYLFAIAVIKDNINCVVPETFIGTICCVKKVKIST